ncbi:MAG TPA: histidine phosphatase family protein [Acidimicrobiales bacterium]|nr:histidine phosphatase family protein [Acidimicrobiales bacterium]
MSDAVREHRQSRFRAPAGATSILLVRHGESAAAREDRPFDLVGGHGDPALHPDGRLQAERVADRLAGEPIRAVYVTTLRRTAETAAPLAARLGVEPQVEADLREVYLGEWEGGVYRRHAAEGHPIARRVLTEERWDVIPGAEPAADFDARVRAGIGRIAGRHPDQLVVAVTHGGVIGSVLAQATGSRPFAFVGADNASISLVVVAGDRWLLRVFNDTGHLAHGFA